VIHGRSGVISAADLPRELAHAVPAQVGASATQPSRRSDVLYERMLTSGDSFWTVVYDAFMLRDLTRDDLRAVVARGLTETRGSYKGLIALFNLPADDYKRFLNVLRKHECRLPFQRYRAMPSDVCAARARGFSEEQLPAKIA
jgi:hypothetical protein